MKIILILVLLLLSSCALGLSGAGNIGRSFVDSVIARGSKAMDATLSTLEEAEKQASIESKRAARAKCYTPFISLKRFALSSDKRRKDVEEDCGLKVNAGGDITVKPLEPTKEETPTQ